MAISTRLSGIRNEKSLTPINNVLCTTDDPIDKETQFKAVHSIVWWAVGDLNVPEAHKPPSGLLYPLRRAVFWTRIHQAICAPDRTSRISLVLGLSCNREIPQCRAQKSHLLAALLLSLFYDVPGDVYTNCL